MELETDQGNVSPKSTRFSYPGKTTLLIICISIISIGSAWITWSLGTEIKDLEMGIQRLEQECVKAAVVPPSSSSLDDHSHDRHKREVPITNSNCVCPTGPRGKQGRKGNAGKGGYQGMPGAKGDRGETALCRDSVPGFNGFPGMKGEKGWPGLPGINGPPGTCIE